jgi:hypothetical protein
MVNIVDLSVEHVLIFVIVAFLLYHFIGGCSCGMRSMRSRDGFSVGGDESCKCNILYNGDYYPDFTNKCIYKTVNNDIAEFDPKYCKNVSESQCTLAGSLQWKGCNVNKCNTVTADKGTVFTYTFDLSVLNLDPTNGSVIYEIVGDWVNTANGKDDPLLLLSDAQYDVLNCLQNQVNIRYIGVNKEGSWWYDYQVLVGINAGEPGGNFIFQGDHVKESLGFTKTSIRVHDVNYNADHPKMTKLTFSNSIWPKELHY